jgi:GNAT superfamily N-acetyltransferase
MTRPAAPDFVIREATPADAAEAARLLAALGYPTPPDVLASRLQSFAAAGETALVAAEGLGRLLGLVTIHLTPVLHRAGPVGRMTALVVDESARGRGVGRALVSAAEALLKARGCVLIEVTSNKRRADAHAFYERLGYDATSLRFGKPLA